MKNIKELTIKELTLINGGVSSNPGTQNWINELGVECHRLVDQV